MERCPNYSALHVNPQNMAGDGLILELTLHRFRLKYKTDEIQY